ncbi:MAG TPA: hypothetical protein VK138_13820 [Acidiferrobacterales bacterium]|nr:hypothetical protein [Acidiferrobacterales bacterium]
MVYDSIIDVLIEAFSSDHCNYSDEKISSYDPHFSGERPTKETIVFELFRLDLFQLFAALTSGSVQESAFSPHAGRIYGEVSERWAKKLGIHMSGDPHALIEDYVRAAHSASWDTEKPTGNPFYAAASVFADSLGILARQGRHNT